MGAAVEPLWIRLGYRRREELLGHFPRRHEDRSRWADPFATAEGEAVTVKGEVTSAKVARWKGGRVCLEVRVVPEGRLAELPLFWFNMPYLKTQFRTGRVVVVHGRLKVSGKGGPRLIHPEYEFVDGGEDEAVHVDRITPIYPLVAGVGQRALRKEIFQLVFREAVPLPERYPAPEEFPALADAVRAMHFPERWEELEAARRRLAYDELLELRLVLARRRARCQALSKVRPRAVADHAERLLRSLPFAPTGAQRRVFAEIDADLQLRRPMNRLLQGDVGSGKTLVAAYALARTLERGQNGALLAPTETLAGQHHRNLRAFFAPLGVSVELWTGSTRPGEAKGWFGGGPVLYVGTHALFQKGADLGELGLGVVDEQHKFGVAQRLAFQEKGLHPDLLMMTATPIPRTLCLALFGDLDISVLDEMPPGRKPVKTVVRSPRALGKVWEFVGRELEAGRQAYVVVPLVEESEKLEATSLKEAEARLGGLFGVERVVGLHGRMESAEKARRMDEFRSGRRGILVATSVVEVGVDVPAATVMVIEHAERFGLAQLHQLRGRVGRGEHQAYCVLVSEAGGLEARDRLRVMEQTQDGFELAEADLRQRGPGDLLGHDQSGLPPLRVAHLLRDRDLLVRAAGQADRMVAEDAELRAYPALRRRVLRHGEAAETAPA